jgi:hypothetical protein
MSIAGSVERAGIAAAMLVFLIKDPRKMAIT